MYLPNWDNQLLLPDGVNRAVVEITVLDFRKPQHRNDIESRKFCFRIRCFIILFCCVDYPKSKNSYGLVPDNLVRTIVDSFTALKLKMSSLDITKAGDSLWLVKVPKYVADKWDSAPGCLEVGKIKVTNTPGKKREISLNLSEAVLCLDGEKNNEPIPKSFKLDVSQFPGQTMAALSEQKVPFNPDAVVQETDKLALLGKITQKLECRPIADKIYMDLKKEAIRKAHIPARRVQKLDKVVHNFKPISDHKHNIDYNEKKKTEGKKARDDKDAVMAMLFKAFEKHQYYNIKDLVTLTKQPVVYLKEILKEVCNYNLKPPHKNMWELKPEYRHYKEQEATETN